MIGALAAKPNDFTADRLGTGFRAVGNLEVERVQTAAPQIEPLRIAVGVSAFHIHLPAGHA